GFFQKKYQTSFVSTLQCTYFVGGYEFGSLVPDYAEALLDAFLMPGHPQKAWLQKIENLARSMGVKIEFIVEPYEASPTTPWEGPLVEALQRTMQKLRPGGKVLPLLGPAVTEARNFRRAGIKTFGFLPIFSAEIPAFHAPNEKISIQDLLSGIEFMDTLLRDLMTN
ncbi:MAG: M20/M25/M40 family metallo-hydrolase, partial [Candidatus Wildermuthbacteria bacterium]|nr:M20/M25/M40 family metallo-hydrolase [Candidatus Wildermuthbacteria bacterium]